VIRWFRDVLRLLREILNELRKLNRPHLAVVQIRFYGAKMADKSLKVGESGIAIVVGKDQFGNPFPIDFGANPPQWSVDQTSNVGLAPGDTADAEVVTGIAATDPSPAILSVSCAGFTATGNVTVTQEPAVLSSIEIQFS
jgi:hypothetical protein